jgi:hypothetical protein
MNRDPLYEKILNRLGQVSDDKLFEARVCDLLRPQWPTMVPVPGGDDAGVDGAWMDDAGRGILVTTTSPKVIANVTRNLTRHLKKGAKGKQVLVATSQALSPPRCRNIEDRIAELGFRSAHQPYTQEAIADLLYHNSRWLNDLLGLSGHPMALSRIPKTPRPMRNLPLIGRDDDLEWLTNTTGDRLLVGQPGIGKTFLCQEYVNRGLGLFAVEDDIQRLANAIRDQEPSTIIIEDAHLRRGLIDDLRRYREETGAGFTIVADSWPGDASAVQLALGIPDSQCRQLEPLLPKSIVAILKAADIAGPSWLLHVLVRQSMGLPGRAAMLAQVCLTESIRKVFEGRALSSWVDSTFSRLLSTRAIQILAAFAIGGQDGMRIDDVAGILGYPPGEVRQDIAGLAFGGVVHDLGDQTVSVLPEPLRSALVCDYFFARPGRLPLDPFLNAARSLGSACSTLIGAQRLGAPISSQRLLQLLEQVPNHFAWEQFAWSDEQNARLVIERHPEMVPSLTRPLLQHVPEFAVPDLLKRGIGDERPLNSHPDHPLRLLHDWAISAEPGTDQPVARRWALWESLKKWLAEGGEQRIALRAMRSVVSPAFEGTEQDPGDVRSLRLRWGAITITVSIVSTKRLPFALCVPNDSFLQMTA